MRWIPVLAIAFLTTAAAQPLLERLRARIDAFPGTVSLYAKNLSTGDIVGIHGTDPVRTASTIKLPIMLAVFDAVARGQAKWTEMLTVEAGARASGTGVIGSEFSDGVRLPLRDALNLMIVLSDNTATNMILERFTADAVNAHLDKIGIKTTRSLRKIATPPSGWSAAGKLPENAKYGIGVSTPRDMVMILEKLERGEIISPEASREMIGILKRCRDDCCIRMRRSSLVVANKTGALQDLRSDVGIVYSKGGPIAMAITVEGIPNSEYNPDNAGSLLIADLAALLVSGLAKNPPAALGAVSYSGDIAPILAMRCNVCHGDSGTAELNVVTVTHAALMKADGVIVPGDPDQSILIQLIEGKRGLAHRMPLHADPLPADQIALIRRWIAEGAKADADTTPRYRLSIPGFGVRQPDALRIECRAPAPAYFILDVRDGARILLERRAASPAAEPVSWTLWPEKNWPTAVSVDVTIRYAAADPKGANLTVKSGSQSRSESGITRLP